MLVTIRPVAEGDQNDKIIRSSSFIFILSIFGMGANYLILTFATKVFPQSAFGEYSLAVSLITFLGMTGTLGIQIAQDRFIPIYRTNNELGRARRFISITFPTVFILTTILSISLYLFSTKVALFFGSPSFGPVLKIFSISIVGIAMIELTTYAYRGFEKPLYQAIFRRFGINTTSFIILTILTYMGFGVSSLYLSYPLAITLLCIVVMSLFYNNIYSKLPRSQSIEYQRVFSYSWPYTFTKATSIFLVYADILFIGYYMTSIDVAIYQVAIGLSAVILLPIRSLVPIYKPICARIIEDNNDDLNPLYNLVSRLSIASGGILIVCYAVAGEGIIRMISTPEYISGAPALLILSIGSGFVLLFGPTGPTLQSTDDSLYFLIVSILKLIGNVTLNILLIPLIGLIGAAVATATSKFMGEILIYKRISNTATVRIKWLKTGKVGISIGGSYLTGDFINNFSLFEGHIETLLVILIIIITYAIISYFFVITKEDILLIQQILPERLKNR